MFKRAFVVLGLGIAVALGAGRTAGAFGVGVGVPTVPVPPVAVPGVVDSMVSGAAGFVAGTVQSVVPSAPDAPVFQAPSEPSANAAPAVSYKAFEDLVNDVQDGGGSPGDVLSSDVFSDAGIDGSVPGVPFFAPNRLLK